VVVVESFPHTATGKIMKTSLREEYGGWLESKSPETGRRVDD